VLEVIGPGSSLSPDDAPLAKGDYFLSFFESCRFPLRDTAPGTVLIDEKTKSKRTTEPVLFNYLRIPVNKAVAAARDAARHQDCQWSRRAFLAPLVSPGPSG
jgi:hypothetical protein